MHLCRYQRPRGRGLAHGVAVDRRCQHREKPTPTSRRARYTLADDAKIRQLKEQGLPWITIPKHFPGRSAGAIEVRYHQDQAQDRRPFSKRVSPFGMPSIFCIGKEVVHCLSCSSARALICWYCFDLVEWSDQPRSKHAFSIPLAALESRGPDAARPVPHHARIYARRDLKRTPCTHSRARESQKTPAWCRMMSDKIIHHLLTYGAAREAGPISSRIPP